MEKVKSLGKQIVSFLLITAVLVGTLPNGMLLVHADGDSNETTYYIEVVNEQNAVIENATVSWIQYDKGEVTSGETTPDETTSGEATPGETTSGGVISSGVAKWDGSKYKLEGLDASRIYNSHLSVTVTHDDYYNDLNPQTIDSLIPQGTSTIIMKNKRTISFAESEITCTYGNVSKGQQIQEKDVEGVEYKILESESDIENVTINADTGEITFPNEKYSGSMTIQANAPATETQKQCVATYVYKVMKREISLEFEKPLQEYPYGKKEVELQPVTLENSDGDVKITYEIVEDENGLATLDKKIIKFNEGKTGEITVKATVDEDDKGYTGSNSYKITVKPAEQKLAFSQSSIVVPWDKKTLNIRNDLSRGAGNDYDSSTMYGPGYNEDGEIEYSIHPAQENDKEIGNDITIDDKGNIKIENSKDYIGDYIITATIGESVTYCKAKAEYRLTIAKADPDMKFESAEVSWNYGENSRYQAVKLPSDFDGSVKYTLSEIKNDFPNGKDVSIDKSSGIVTFPEEFIGTVKVKASIKGSNLYQDKEAEYEIKIGYKNFLNNFTQIKVNEKAIKDIDHVYYYNDDINIVAPSGFGISTSYAWNQNWNQSLKYSSEKNGPVVVYLREESTGAISEAYTINKVQIDKTIPTGEVTKNIANGVTNQNQTMEIRLKDELSGIDEKSIKLDYTATDLKGDVKNAVTYSVSGTEKEKIVTIQCTADANYKISKLTCKDIAGNVLEQNIGATFTIDKTAPKTGNMSVSYSKELNKWEEILNKVTFGYYAYQKKVTVTLTAQDNLSGISSMEWKYAKQNGTSTTDYVESDAGKLTKLTINKDGSVSGSFTLTAEKAKQYRGNITFTATDAAGNTSATKKENNIVIVDNVSPTKTVTLTPAVREADGVLYYDDAVKATFTITEANFYASDVKVTVDGSQKKIKNWKQDGDTWTGTLKISGEGEHQLRMTYKDRSNNKMSSYTAKKIVIDTKAPEISVSYQDDVAGVNNTNYYAQPKTATITIEEANFNAKDIVAAVTAKDSAGNDVAVMDYASYLSNPKNWKHSGNKWIATISYTTDANYIFDIDYTDYVGHAAMDYTPDRFTVDQTAPTNLSVSYSTGIVERILNAVTFGYYNEKVTVTISAEDITSGIEHFQYSYKKADGVSPVNAEKINAVLEQAAIEQEGTVFTTTFAIPEDVLSATTQFNGTVNFTAYDYAANTTDKEDTKRLVVDNMKPVADVSISEAVNAVNGVSYYAGAIEVTVTIQEANFDAEDVVLAVTKDGAAIGTPISWTDTSVDVHVGTFTLQEDGDYAFTIDYTDKSQNVMDQYVSEQLTIDTEVPTVSVTNIKNHSANKEDTYSFSIIASDTNFDTASFKPVLSAVVMNENGQYTTQAIDLGTMRIAGDNYSYYVENLEADAVYSLSCEVSDLAGNTYSKVVLTDDGNEECDEVQFSINRNGSTYALEKDAEKIVEQYYVYDIVKDMVIDEINVDPVNDYTVTLNGNALTEGTDYTTELTEKEGEWSKRSYILKNSLFNAEGEYNVVVESTDKTDTTSYSDVKNLNVTFVVDQTAPVLTVSGLKQDGRYQTAEQTVTVIPTDDGGKLNSFKAVVSDADGLKKDVRFEMTGEEFENYLAENSGVVTFTVPEGLNQQVELICNDKAVHTDGTTNECREAFTKVTVSPSGFVMLYANKLLLYSIIGGVVILIMLSGTAVVFVRKKKVRKVK